MYYYSIYSQYIFACTTLNSYRTDLFEIFEKLIFVSLTITNQALGLMAPVYMNW